MFLSLGILKTNQFTLSIAVIVRKCRIQPSMAIFGQILISRNLQGVSFEAVLKIEQYLKSYGESLTRFI